jgi:hypothetical protein
VSGRHANSVPRPCAPRTPADGRPLVSGGLTPFAPRPFRSLPGLMSALPSRASPRVLDRQAAGSQSRRTRRSTRHSGSPDPFDAVVLAQIGPPSAIAQNEFSARLRSMRGSLGLSRAMHRAATGASGLMEQAPDAIKVPGVEDGKSAVRPRRPVGIKPGRNYRRAPARPAGRRSTTQDCGPLTAPAVFLSASGAIPKVPHACPVKREGALNRRCAAMSCSRFCLVSI